MKEVDITQALTCYHRQGDITIHHPFLVHANPTDAATRKVELVWLAYADSEQEARLHAGNPRGPKSIYQNTEHWMNLVSFTIGKHRFYRAVPDPVLSPDAKLLIGQAFGMWVWGIHNPSPATLT